MIDMERRKRAINPATVMAKGQIKKHPKKVLYLSYGMRMSTGYDGVLLSSILSHHGKLAHTTSEYSLQFNSVLSSITPEMRNLYYRSGISTGRLLYSIFMRKRRYVWYEESVADLVAFFGEVGFSEITYNVFPDKVEIRFHNCDKSYLGANMHRFEAGIISGFLTAGKGQQLTVTEVSCMSNGGDSCHFVTAYQPMPNETYGIDLLEQFAANSKLHYGVSRASESKMQHFLDEYYMLRLQLMVSAEYLEYMEKIAYHAGRSIGASLGINEARIKRSPKSIERAFEMLNPCKLKVESAKPFRCEMGFSMIKSKKGLVDISTAFLSGLIDDILAEGQNINVSTAKRNGSYIARVTVG